MDIQPQNQQPISDDQELAKVLAGVNQQADEVAATTPSDDTATSAPVAEAVEAPEEPATLPEPTPALESEPVVAPSPVTQAAPALSSDLDAIKRDALTELRPLVDKLEVSPEEKFDTYLLLLRSTDDQALIAPAHEAAKNIPDETRRAQALLDIIKEIDYLAGGQQPTV